MDEAICALAWVENHTTLHKQVEILYVVDGYQVTITYDSELFLGPWHGETVLLAIQEAMKHVS